MNETTDASAIFAPLWRFKWFILSVALIVAAATYVYYNSKPVTYVAATQVNLANGVEEAGGQPATSEPTRKRGRRAAAVSSPYAPQANLANSPVIHQSVVYRLRATHTPAAEDALRSVPTARIAEPSAIMVISAQGPSAVGAALLANTTAVAFVEHQNAGYVSSTEAAIVTTRQQLRAVELALAANPAATVGPGKGNKKSGLSSKTSDILVEASLKTQLNHLEGSFGVTSVRQLGLATARSATALESDPKKNAIFGFFIGAVLAAVAAYTLNRFDRRVRTLAGIEEVFETQVLSALPNVKRPIVYRDGRLAPSPVLNEPLRRLNTTLRLGEMLNGGQATRVRSILFLSADAADGKSTVAAGLALVQRDAGEQVSLIEADFRRPVQARLLGTGVSGGLFDVLTGALTFEEALQPVEGSLDGRRAMEPVGASAAVATLVDSRSTGTLSVLLGEQGAPNPPALLGSSAMAALVRSAAEEFDHVLIDAPPPLMVSDAMPLLGEVDGIVLVARVGHTREASAKRLVQLLARNPNASVLGVVANDVSRADMQRYGFSLGYTHRGWLGRLLGR
jgi:Mrp family chromosome partitioning ATPase/capsular polysaccharide biosynthesis protein